MRGKGQSSGGSGRRVGITPAYAGKSNHDHGRHRYQAGSPPPMRGKVFISHKTAADFGITPAYAGKRSALPALSCSRPDHPRLCGEKSLSAFFTAVS